MHTQTPPLYGHGNGTHFPRVAYHHIDLQRLLLVDSDRVASAFIECEWFDVVLSQVCNAIVVVPATCRSNNSINRAAITPQPPTAVSWRVQHQTSVLLDPVQRCSVVLLE